MPISYSGRTPLGRFWYAVGSADVCASTRPMSMTLLGQDLVAWRAPGGDPVVVPDRCSHRMQQLRAGIVAEGCLVCPHHGWTFGDDGRCVRRPSGGAIAEKAHLRPLASVERSGVVWASTGASPGAPGGEGPWAIDDTLAFGGTIELRASARRVVAGLLTGALGSVSTMWAASPFIYQLFHERSSATLVVAVTPHDGTRASVTVLRSPTHDASCRDLLGALEPLVMSDAPCESSDAHEWEARLRVLLDAAAAAPSSI